MKPPLRQPCCRRTLKRSSPASGLKTLSTPLGAGALRIGRYYLFGKILSNFLSVYRNAGVAAMAGAESEWMSIHEDEKNSAEFFERQWRPRERHHYKKNHPPPLPLSFPASNRLVSLDQTVGQGNQKMTAVIKADNLAKTYGEVQAVNDVSLSVEQGALFGLLGPNGSGKTTMIKMLTGQTRPTGGSASVLGIDVTQDPVGIRARVGIIPEQETPPSFLTAMEYLKFVAAVRKIPDIGKKADWWFDFLDFADKKDVLCKDLSRGTRQKLMFTQAFIHEPEIALIDEPLINFDPIMQDLVKDYLAKYVKNGKTIFISTHILEVAEEVCSEFAILHKGTLLHTGPVAELKARGEHLPAFFLSLVGKGRHV